METMDWGRGLPLDIGMLIFSRLVISDLPACRLVCKTWNALILDYASSSKSLTNDFILSVSDKVFNSELSRPCNPRLYCYRFDPTKHLDLDFDVLELEGNKSASSLRFDGDLFFVTLLNSCNGLLFICKSNYESMCFGIFNLMTNEFFQVPQIDDDIYDFGLGFIPTTKQYKLFRVNNSVQPNSIMEVFTFGINPKQNQWRHLHSLPHHTKTCGVYQNGVIYWLGKQENEQNEPVIYALDVETEKIELSAILKVGPDSSLWPNIQLFNGHVYAIIYINPPATHYLTIQVWRMHEKDSWIREFVMDDVPKDWRTIVLVKAFTNGEILFLLKSWNSCSFWLYNPLTGRKKIVMKTQNKLFIDFHPIESMNFGSLPHILVGNETRMMKSRSRNKLMRRRRKRGHE